MISAFFLGLLGSLHCFLMCGPLVATVGIRAGGKLTTTALIYQMGRILIYCCLGILAGMLGYGFSLFGLHQYIAIALGLVLIYLALHEFFSLPIIFRFNLSSNLSMRLIRWKNKLKINSPFLMGMANGLLPCGLVYVALTGSLIYETPQESAFYMLLFGLGTCPVMIGCFLFPKLNLNLKISFFPRLYPLAILFMGIWLLSRGMSLGVPYLSPDKNTLKINQVEATENCIRLE